MKKGILGSVVLGLMMSAPAIAQQFPPADSRPGECYAKVLIPAIYQTAPEEVLVEPGKKEIKKVEAVYKDVEKEVLVEEESFELVPVPPVYETVTEQVLIEPSKTVKTVVPATYRTETKEIMVSPARVVWKKGRGAYEKLDEATGEIMCRVEVPAVFKTVEQQVVATPPQEKEEVIPAVFRSVERRVMKTPPTTTKRIIPAKYETITVKELVTPESIEEVEIPPKFATVEKRQLVSPEKVEWRPILCETNTTPEIIAELQRALITAGYKQGVAADGTFGPATASAVRKYQTANGLPTGGLTISTLNRLGVKSVYAN